MMRATSSWHEACFFRTSSFATNFPPGRKFCCLIATSSSYLACRCASSRASYGSISYRKCVNVPCFAGIVGMPVLIAAAPTIRDRCSCRASVRVERSRPYSLGWYVKLEKSLAEIAWRRGVTVPATVMSCFFTAPMEDSCRSDMLLSSSARVRPFSRTFRFDRLFGRRRSWTKEVGRKAIRTASASEFPRCCWLSVGRIKRSSALRRPEPPP
mmetsp:Transcript_14881/g.35978  ORF Transcript_14881/g.35978 Transcript_14881/m.35978 type:complete len:212 (-) Transcript_14881:23-658(-)